MQQVPFYVCPNIKHEFPNNTAATNTRRVTYAVGGSFFNPILTAFFGEQLTSKEVSNVGRVQSLHKTAHPCQSHAALRSKVYYSRRSVTEASR